ncbi:LysR family transcriptional regulator [Pseudochelatococcus sp. B33]
MRYFIKVVEVGSLTGAADHLNVAQPALGLQIRNLEEELSVSLLVRHSRGVQTTPAGEFLYRRAVSLIQAMNETRREVMNFVEDARETIRFGVTPSILKLMGPDLLIEAREIMPNVFLSLVEEMSYNLITTIDAGNIDAAFVYTAGDRSLTEFTALFDEDLLFLSSPDIDSSTDVIPFAEVARRDLVLPGQMDIVRTLINKTAARLSISLNVPYETQSNQAMRNLILKGLASGVTPYGSVKEDVDRGLMVARRIVRPEVCRTLYLARRPRHEPFRAEGELQVFLKKCLSRLYDELGDLVRPLGEI